MTIERLRIATRKSPLALWQAEFVKSELIAHHPGLEVELVTMTTEGDRQLGQRLSAIGGKGLFIKELEKALLEQRADIAVHSMKDMTVELPEGFAIGAICARHNPCDALVSQRFNCFDDMPPGTIVGTASLRRQCIINYNYPDLEVRELRGNVNTRLAKLDAGEYDAIVLACAGLERLGMAERIAASLSDKTFLPAVGQGAVGIEYVEARSEIKALIEPLNDEETTICVTAERVMNRCLGGGCHVPIAGYAEMKGQELLMQGLVGLPNGAEVKYVSHVGSITDPEALGEHIANQLLELGAGELLQRVYDETQ